MEKKKYVRKSKSLSSKKNKNLVTEKPDDCSQTRNCRCTICIVSKKLRSIELRTIKSNSFNHFEALNTELDREYKIKICKESYPYFQDLVSLIKLIILIVAFKTPIVLLYMLANFKKIFKAISLPFLNN
ncbi:MAG: hypothetical protein JNL75_11885 [Chitinophagales bacterium]|nr:hypothetical protein [Chitinophagales bacterium]